MAKMAKPEVLVLEQHSHFFFPPCRDIGVAHCAGIDPNRNVHILYFPHIQEIPFECIKKEQLPNRRQMACICTRETPRPFSREGEGKN